MCIDTSLFSTVYPANAAAHLPARLPRWLGGISLLASMFWEFECHPLAFKKDHFVLVVIGNKDLFVFPFRTQFIHLSDCVCKKVTLISTIA